MRRKSLRVLEHDNLSHNYRSGNALRFSSNSDNTFRVVWFETITCTNRCSSRRVVRAAYLYTASSPLQQITFFFVLYSFFKILLFPRVVFTFSHVDEMKRFRAVNNERFEKYLRHKNQGRGEKKAPFNHVITIIIRRTISYTLES